MLYLCSSTNRSILDYPDAIRVGIFDVGIGYFYDPSRYTSIMYASIADLTAHDKTTAILSGARLYALPDNALESRRVVHADSLWINSGIVLFDQIPSKIHSDICNWIENGL